MKTAAIVSTILVAIGVCFAAPPATVPAHLKPHKSRATLPTEKDPKRQAEFAEVARAGNIDLVFEGDSITDNWRGLGGKKIWEDVFVPLKAANFGIGGDRTENVLWRQEHGELDSIQPRLVVLMIGTNNLDFNTDAEIADGIAADVNEIKKHAAKSKILLLGIFPRGYEADNPLRARIKTINSKIAVLDDQKTVYYMDIGEHFVDKDGALLKDALPDSLHPNAKGYRIWADAILPKVKELMGTK